MRSARLGVLALVFTCAAGAARAQTMVDQQLRLIDIHNLLRVIAEVSPRAAREAA